MHAMEPNSVQIARLWKFLNCRRCTLALEFYAFVSSQFWVLVSIFILQGFEADNLWVVTAVWGKMWEKKRD